MSETFICECHGKTFNKNDRAQMRDYLSTHGWKEYKPGRWLLSAGHPGGKGTIISDSEAADIRTLRRRGWLMRNIAQRYDISLSSVSLICSGKRHDSH